MRVLGIETSCDDTAAAIYCGTQGLIKHTTASQIDIHAQYGGVVPELAARDHGRKLLPLIDYLLNSPQNQQHKIDAIAYTQGPGLSGALLVGASLAKTLADAWHIPAIGIHHLEGHLLAPMLEKDTPDFPFIALLVSGGHTLLVDVAEYANYQILGQSVDDAAGEAFDKVAKLLGLGYPGGPLIAKLAESGDPERFRFTRPMLNRPGLDFSFSGLKTQVRTLALQLNSDPSQLDEQTKADIAIAFELCVVETLINKCLRACKQQSRTVLVMAGGVAANKRLRTSLQQKAGENGIRVFYPDMQFCTDNGAMIAIAGYLRLQHGLHDTNRSIIVNPRWPLEQVNYPTLSTL